MTKTFKLKADIGDYVWFMYENKPQKGKIVCIDITLRDSIQFPQSIDYFVSTGPKTPLGETIIFKTKDELLNSLR